MPRAACNGDEVSSARLRRSTPIVRVMTSSRRAPRISLQHVVAAGIARRGQRFGDAIGESGGVAEAEIEPLRADRRKNMRGLADEHGAVRGEPIGAEPGHGEKLRGPTLSI